MEQPGRAGMAVGDSEIAKEWFTKALTIEPEKAQENLNKIK